VSESPGFGAALVAVPLSATAEKPAFRAAAIAALPLLAAEGLLSAAHVLDALDAFLQPGGDYATSEVDVPKIGDYTTQVRGGERGGSEGGRSPHSHTHTLVTDDTLFFLTPLV
jgi:hypothetical protein